MLPGNDTWDDEAFWIRLPLSSFKLRSRFMFEFGFSTNLAALPRVFSRILSMSGSVVTSGSACRAGGAGGAGGTCTGGIAVAVTELTVISVGKVFQCCPLKDVVWPPYWH